MKGINLKVSNTFDIIHKFLSSRMHIKNLILSKSLKKYEM